jgi:hypothetical protein
MLFQHLIYSAKERPWRLVGFIIFLIGLGVLVFYVTTHEYSSPEDSSKSHVNPAMAVTNHQVLSEFRTGSYAVA